MEKEDIKKLLELVKKMKKHEWELISHIISKKFESESATVKITNPDSLCEFITNQLQWVD